MTMKIKKISFVVVLLLGWLGGRNASAQPSGVSCNTFPSGPTAAVRSEALADLVGEITVNCFLPGFNASPVVADIKLTLNTNITSNRDFGLGSAVTDAVLLTSCPFPFCGPPPPPLFGRLVADNAVQWDAVTVLPPGTDVNVFFRITNLRAKAFGLTGTAPQVMATVSMSGSTPITIFPGPTLVAFSQPGLDAILLVSGGFESFRVRLREGFPTAFKLLGLGSAFAPFPLPNEEAGYPVPGSGANQGTRFMIRLIDAPKSANVLVPHSLQLGSGGLELRRVFHSDSNGARGCLYQFCLEPAPPGSLGPVEISGGMGSVVYEVTNLLPPTSPFALGPDRGPGCCVPRWV